MDRLRRWLAPGRAADGALFLLLAAGAFLLGCYEMGDTDVWWHLAGGRWILEHGRAPSLDPFTFGSADRPWIDIHWAYEVVLYLTYRAGGVGALVLLGAVAGGLAFLAALSARGRDWPAAAVVLAWLPALVLFAFRLDPRPEIFSLLFIGCFLAVLWRLDDRPALAWLLPAPQVLWVNVQGLFVFGPILVGMFLAARGARLAWDRLRGVPGGNWARRWWLHVGGAGLAVVAACLVNPYGLAGARFPLDLFPKVAAKGNPYKQYIDELMSPRDYVADATAAVAGTNWFFLAFYFLLLPLPLSFVFPATWRAWRAGVTPGKRGKAQAAPAPSAAAWLGGTAAAVVLLAATVLTTSDRLVPAWAVAAGDAMPLVLLAGAVMAAVLLRRRSGEAAVLAVVGGAALAGWAAWLRGTLLGAGSGVAGAAAGVGPLTLLLVPVGLAAAALVLRRGGDLFRLLLAAAFVYLGLQALQNWTRLALVAGAVLAWNFGEWGAELAAGWSLGRARAAAGWSLRAALAAILGLWLGALATDHYYVHTGEPRHLAFREERLAFAHDAVTFAGRPGLPERALVYGLGQTGLYDFQNGPRCQPYMDGRLEMPALETFKTYITVEQWLRQQDPRWERPVAEMGNPLLLLEHTNNYAAEALLLTHPDWRCIYYDAQASVFVRRDDREAGGFPEVDFAARHFTDPAAPPVPAVRGAAAREEKALFNLAASLPRAEAAGRRRLPLLLAALDRARQAAAEDPTRADVWVLRGDCYWALTPDLRARPPGPADPWDTQRDITWAQSTYCFRRAASCQPDNAAAWRSLFRSFAARGMVDAQRAAGEKWLRFDPHTGPRERKQVEDLAQALARQPATASSASLREAVGELLRAHRPDAAVRLMDREGEQGWDWAFAEQAAGLYMHLGRPADARRVWLAAPDCPSEALRRCRLAATYWAEGDLEGAARGFEGARAGDPRRAEAWWALAVVRTQQGQAGPALEACRRGLSLQEDEARRSQLRALKQFLEPYAATP